MLKCKILVISHAGVDYEMDKLKYIIFIVAVIVCGMLVGAVGTGE